MPRDLPARSTAAARANLWLDLIDFTVDPDDAQPLFQQIHLGLRRLIVSGAIPAGARLPPTRALAARLKVARTTTVAAYEQLHAEGVVEGRVGAGTWVVPGLRQETPGRMRRGEAAHSPDATSRARRNPGDGDIASQSELARRPFATGVCAMPAASQRAWRRLVVRRLGTIGSAHLGYGDPFGSLELRTALAGYLRVARSVICDPAQIAIVSGTQHGIDLALRVLSRPGDAAWIEDPCYPGAAGAFRQYGLDVVPVAVDEKGLDVAAGMRRAPHARLAYVTPSHQYPLGMAMHMSRRLALLRWAKETDAWIIEDDYDSEFRFEGRPQSALQGLDTAGRVIHIGSLSKVLFPGLRLGYVVMPPALIERFAQARHLSDRFPASLVHDVVTDFILEGSFTAHIRRTRALYARSRDALAGLADRHLASIGSIAPADRGMHLLLCLKPGLDDRRAAEAAASAGVVTKPLSPMYLGRKPRHGLLLGFTGFARPALDEAVRRLAQALRRL